ncbi:MAG: hypothetical protein D6717_04900 [Gammaproteobacteria bacterium]|nr:MAG: hypothetical protein D6717_04900 [Gammaproteobacteria bacterium]
MNEMVVFQLDFDETLRRRLRNTGIALLLIGLLGIILPQVLTFALSLLVGGLLVAAGVVSLYLAGGGYRRSLLAWLRSFVLLVIGLLIAFHPTIGAASLGLLLIIYFLFSAFGALSLAFAMRPLPGWGWMLVNGLLALLLAVIFIFGWPFQAKWLVGLFVGINLVFDGLALLMVARAARP